MEIELECPNCGRAVCVRAWDCGECPECHCEYGWDENPNGDPMIDWRYDWENGVSYRG